MAARSRSSSASRSTSPTSERPSRVRRASAEAVEAGAVILTRAKDSSAALEHSPANFSLESPVASVFGHFMTSLVVDSPARPPASSPASQPHQPPTISKSADERINLPKLLQMKGWQHTDLNSELANEAAAQEVIQMPSTKGSSTSSLRR